MCLFVFFFKQKTAYDVRISDWSSDVCASDLVGCSLVMFRIFLLGALRPGPPLSLRTPSGVDAATGLRVPHERHARRPRMAVELSSRDGADGPKPTDRA